MISRLLTYTLRIAGILLVIVLGLVLFGPLGGNLYFLVTEPGYFIPDESTVLTFRPLVLNPGPGEEWIYGEDGRWYYYNPLESGADYRVLPKKTAKGIDNFDALNIDTWK